MSQHTCHYCLKVKDNFSITGQFRVKGEKFVCYRLCDKCSKNLVGINTYSDKQARQTFLTTVRKNAKANPIYK